MAAFALSASPALAGSAPGAVSSVSLARGDGTVTAKWDAPTGATQYHVTYSDDGGKSWSLAAYGDSATRVTFGADNASTYVVGVRAGNDHGWSGWVNSPPAGPYVPPLRPPATIGAVDVTRADGSLTASWDAVDRATKHRVTYTSDKGASWSLAALDHPSNSITISVDNDKTYVVGVRAGNHAGWSGWANSPASGPYVPPTPPTVSATRGEDGASASVSWTAYDGSDFSYYRVIICTDEQYDGASCSGAVFQSDPIYEASSTGPITAKGLQAQTGYGIILQTWRTGGTGALKAHATLPGGPTGLTVTPSDGNLTVSWNAVTGATSYDVESSTSLTGDGWKAEHSNTSSTSVTVTDDANNSVERVRVRARNAGGPGPWAELSRGPSNDWLTTVQQSGASAQSAQAQSQLAAPATITVTRDNARDEKLHVSWTAVSGAGGYNVACSDTGGWGTLDGSGNSGWWQCGSTTSATSLTVDNNDRDRDLGNRNYMVAVRAVTSNPADASDWKRSEDIRPVVGQLDNLTYSRSGGSITLSWTPNLWITGYEIDCAVYGQTYTRCATLTGQDDTAAQHSVTLSSWTVGSNTYTIDDGATYAIKITSTNQWGDADMLVPLIGPIPNVSNLGAASDTYGQQVSSVQEAAVGFGTGGNSGGYTLQGVTIRFLAVDEGRDPTAPLTVAIHEASGGDPVSSTTHTLSLVHGDPKAAGYATYACSGACSLSASTTYFLMLKTSSANAYKWDTTASGDQTNAGTSGWTIDDVLKQGNGNRWTDRTWTAAFRVSATPNPSLTASNVTATGATLTISNHDGSWWYKSATTGKTTCTSAGSNASVSVTGLTAGASYTFSAYSDSTCTTANLLTTAASFTTPVTVSNLSQGFTGSVGVSNGNGNIHANQFRTGGNSGDYTLSGVTVDIGGKGSGAGPLQVEVWSDSSGNPGSKVSGVTLSANDPTASSGQLAYTCSGACTLSASTNYWVRLSTNSGSGQWSWNYTSSGSETLEPSGNGWQIGDNKTLALVSSNIWVGANGYFKIKVTAVPK